MSSEAEPRTREHVEFDAPDTRAGRRRAIVVAAFVAATIVMTWPYVSYRSVGYGQYEGDARLVVWILAWANHAVTEGLPLFRSNLFFPAPDTLRYNEHLFGVSVFTLPLALAGVPAVVAHNVVWWLAFPANGLAAYAWLRQYVRDRVAATLGGLAFAFSFYVMLHAHSHLHLVWIWGLPLSFLLLERWFDRPTLRRALVWAAVLVVQILTSWYLAVIAAVATGVMAAVLAATDRRASTGGGGALWPRRGLHLLAAGALIVAVVTPFARPYVGLTSTIQAADASATLDSYLVPPANTVAGRWWLAHVDDRPRWIWGEQTLFAGWTVLALSLVGLTELWRRRSSAPRGWVLLLLAVVGFFMSLGPSPPLLGGSALAPYAWLSMLPGVGGMRASARFAVLVTLGLAGLAALGAERLRRDGAARGRVAVLAAVPLMGVEWFVVDFPAGPPRPLDIPAVYRSDEVRSARALLSLPDAFGTPLWYVEADYLYFSTAHWRPIVNGFGRGFPPGHADLVDIARRFPATAPTLRAFGVQYVVVHAARYPRMADTPVAAAMSHPSVRLVRQFDTDYLFELVE
jgi:hypothetical protein